MSPSWSVTRSGTARGERGPQAGRAVVRYQFAQVSHADHAVDLDDFGVSHSSSDITSLRGLLGAPATCFSRTTSPRRRRLRADFKFADEIFGFVFEFEITVAQ